MGWPRGVVLPLIPLMLATGPVRAKAGAEFSPTRRRGPFAFAGAGLGHASLRRAHGRYEPPDIDGWYVPPRDVTAFAIGGALGIRTVAGPGPLGFQAGVRGHTLIHAGYMPASSWGITLGLAY